MKTLKKFLIFAGILMMISSMCFAKPKTSKYVCSTSWVAAIAELAGVDDVVTIAPVNLKHPPEYEITPMDILNVVKADLIMHAGYEKMVKTMTASAEIDQNKMLKVRTTNTLDNLEKMIIAISEKTGTQKAAATRFNNYKKMILDARKNITQKGLDKIPVYVNVNQAEFARDLGLNVVDTFGGGPLTSAQIAQVAKEKYALVIDNVHNPVADPILEVSPDTKILIWRNFPEKLEKNSLYKVVKSNIDSLLKLKL